MKTIQRHPLVAFFTLALAITWIFQTAATMLAPGQGMTINNEKNLLYFLDLLTLRLSWGQAGVYALFTVGAGPLIAALFVAWVTEGRAGLHDLWRQTTKWNISVRWYLIALLLPVVLSAASLGVGLLAGDAQLNAAPRLTYAYFLPFLLYMIIFTGIVEEIGWRGFALPRLQRRFTAYQSSWILGVLIGVWHMPFIAYYLYPQGLIAVVISFLILALGSVGWAIVVNWLYNNTGSVWLIILLHGWGNTVQSYLVLSSNSMTAQAIYGILPWTIALVLLWIYGKQHLARHPRPQHPAPIPPTEPAYATSRVPVTAPSNSTN